MKFSIILPVYNEAHRVPSLAQSYRAKLEELGYSWELLLVVNGSRDDSYAAACREAAADPRVRAFELVQGGWGRAVKLGLREARGEFVCYTNAARTNLEDLGLFLRYAQVSDQMLVKATRIVRESWLRKLGSVLYNSEFRALFQVPVWDVNGTPKVLPRPVLEQLGDVNFLSDGDLVDAQLVLWAWRRQIRALEVPVVSKVRMGGKTSTTNLWSAAKMYAGLLGLWSQRELR